MSVSPTGLDFSLRASSILEGRSFRILDFRKMNTISMDGGRVISEAISPMRA
jgi:hypothetical protein